MTVPRSEIARLLAAAGVGSSLSYRAAARLTGLSHGTIERLYKSAHIATTHHRPPREETLNKLSSLPGLNNNQLQRALLIDLGYLHPNQGNSLLIDILMKIVMLSPMEQKQLMAELARIIADEKDNSTHEAKREWLTLDVRP